MKLRVYGGVVYLIVLITAICAGCGDGDKVGAVSWTSLETPRVTGIYVASESRDVIGIWRQPNSQGRVFPNPANVGLVELVFNNVAVGDIKLWVVRALGPDDPEGTSHRIGGAIVPPAEGQVVRTVAEDYWIHHDIDFGMILAVWDGRDDQGNKVPPGYYRVYVTAGEQLQWADMFLWGPGVDLPDDMLSAYGYYDPY